MDERYLKPFRDPKITGISAGLMGLGVGLVVGYILGRRQRQYTSVIPSQDWSIADLASVPDDEAVEFEVKVDAPEEVIENGAAFVQGVITQPEEAPVRQSIFTDVNDDWNYEVETAKRVETEPHVLHRDEFWGDEKKYTQTTLTYYAGDDILVDEDDKPIYNYSTIIGQLNFGHGSGDQNTFYVRNNKLRAEYEIIKDGGLYSVEVLGLEIEENARATDIQHSGDRKFRQD